VGGGEEEEEEEEEARVARSFSLPTASDKLTAVGLLVTR